MDYLQYYAIDWLAMLLTLIAIWLMGNKNKQGFVLMMLGNVCWIMVGYFSASMAMIIANVVFLGMNLHALRKWSKDP